MKIDPTLKNQLISDGFAVADRFADEKALASLVVEVESLFRASDQTRRMGGVRNPLGLSKLLADLAAAAGLHRLASQLLDAEARPVRSILFDKPTAANWAVPWHQDVTIAVRGRVEADGFGPWSIKDGVHHVQPPAEVLAGMVTLRLSIDECHAMNGPLRAVPGSHTDGLLSSEQVSAVGERGPVVDCTTQAGGLVIMRPLIVHSSKKAERPDHRRVLHIEYAAGHLPGGLVFAE